ncbi:MAG: ABC transporter permease [Thaumarchaeota archaeon]|nr:ABC transporter permease [Nitrososphaerota archaeon]
MRLLDNIVRIFLGNRLIQVTELEDQDPTESIATMTAEAEKPSTSTSGISFTFRFLRKDKPALAGMVVIAAFLIWALVEGIMQSLAGYLRSPKLGWMLLPSNPVALSFSHSLAPPSLSNIVYLFGANYEGQSILSQILYATPHDAIASVLVVVSAIVIGMLIGIPAGYVGGWVDEILMRVTDAFLAFPYLVLAIAFSVLLGSGFLTVLLALSLIWWPTYARYFRAQTIALKYRNFVEASKLSGVSSLKIMFRHIMPNSIDPIIAQATLDFGSVIILYSTLAFLGIGLQLNYPEWGAMSSAGVAYFPASWWWTLIPGFVIMIIVIAFSMIGDRLQDLIGGRITY